MSMTETEAREKWCPMVRFHTFADGSAASNLSAMGDDIHRCQCIASDCMMWQEIGHKRDDEPKGYCGLIRI